MRGGGYMTDQFSKQNDILEDAQKDLQKQVDAMGEHCKALQENTASLKQKVGEFDDVRVGLERIAEETGRDVQDLLRNSNKIFNKMQDLNDANERITLERIAQDVEFLNNKEGFSQDEWNRFVTRIPAKFKKKLP